MKALIIGDKERYIKYDPDTAFRRETEKCFVPLSLPPAQYPPEALDADFVATDAIAVIDRALISRMPNVKIIHSEGVAYNGIDLEAAAERGIYVCNNRGCNADAVAEQALLLMLGVLRHAVQGDRAVREGRQIETKTRLMQEGMTELGECTVGLIGFGDIAKQTALRLNAFHCRLLYHASHRRSREEEERYHVSWADYSRMQKECQIISLHVPVTDETRGMIDEKFLRAMRPDSYLINTARGEIVDNAALCRALSEGWICGAGLDTVAPEPVTPDNPLLNLPAEAEARIFFSPHCGGISQRIFRLTHENMWRAFERVSKGERPDCIVNGI